MADQVTPLGGRNFVVRITEVGPRGGGGRSLELSFEQVVLPAFRVDDRRPGETDETGDDLLVLRRGHTGASELYDWWTDERDPKHRSTRTVEVTALDDGGRAVTRWRFDGCHLVALRYSPLDALHSAVLTESAEIAFDTVGQHRAGR